MESKYRACTMLAAALLSACGGDDGGSGGSTASCDVFSGGATISSSAQQVNCGGCTTSPDTNVKDGNLSSAATINTPAGSSQIVTYTIRAQSGIAFPAGSKPGLLITRSGSAAPSSVSVSTTLNGATVETASGGAGLSFDSTGASSGAAEYAGFTATATFNGLTIQVTAQNGSSSMRHEIYEACSNGRAR